MGFLKKYISSLRLRTLPLSLAGVSLGSMLAVADFHVRPAVVISVLVTACLLQVVSNVANELGDFLRGTSSGHKRAASEYLASGELTADGLRLFMRCLVALTLISGLVLIYLSFGTVFSLDAFVLMIFGYFSVKAAVSYTLGKNPYGYRGRGDVYVFVFFGLVAVLGSYFVCTHTFGTLKLLLPAVSSGVLCTAVINLNNLRDIETDRHNRITVAGKLGKHGAKIYQTALIAVGWTAMTAYSIMSYPDPWHYLYVLSLPLFAWHLHSVWKMPSEKLDGTLPVLVVSVFLFCVLAGAGFLMYMVK